MAHELNCPWDFWVFKRYDPEFTNRTYNESRFKLSDTPISTIENFWSYFNYIKKPDELNYEYEGIALFRFQQPPDTENKNNKSKLTYYMKTGHNDHNLNQIYLDLILICIGENIENSTRIQGIKVIRRMNNSRVEVWFNESISTPRIKNLIHEINKQFPTLDHYFSSINEDTL